MNATCILSTLNFCCLNRLHCASSSSYEYIHLFLRNKIRVQLQLTFRIQNFKLISNVNWLNLICTRALSPSLSPSLPLSLCRWLTVHQIYDELLNIYNKFAVIICCINEPLKNYVQISRVSLKLNYVYAQLYDMCMLLNQKYVFVCMYVCTFVSSQCVTKAST